VLDSKEEVVGMTGDLSWIVILAIVMIIVGKIAAASCGSCCR